MHASSCLIIQLSGLGFLSAEKSEIAHVVVIERNHDLLRSGLLSSPASRSGGFHRVSGWCFHLVFFRVGAGWLRGYLGMIRVIDGPAATSSANSTTTCIITSAW